MLLKASVSLRNQGKDQRSSKKEEKILGSLFLRCFEVMDSSFMFFAQSDPDFHFCFLRWHEAKTQQAD